MSDSMFRRASAPPAGVRVLCEGAGPGGREEADHGASAQALLRHVSYLCIGCHHYHKYAVFVAACLMEICSDHCIRSTFHMSLTSLPHPSLCTQFRRHRGELPSPRGGLAGIRGCGRGGEQEDPQRVEPHLQEAHPLGGPREAQETPQEVGRLQHHVSGIAGVQWMRLVATGVRE